MEKRNSTGGAATPVLGRDVLIREYAPLHHLLNAIPQKAQRGLRTSSVDLTCIDITREYVAVGSNIGIIFLYDRDKQTVQRLKCQVKDEAVTCLQMKQSLDYVVAAGLISGRICIFQLPSVLPGRAKQLQMFTVDDMHKSEVTSVEWSNNAMKLFSGDRNGLVVCTELDYGKCESKSFELLQERNPIVQLNYAHKCLLVSSKQRTFLCYTDKNNSITQVGKKDRKIYGGFGACFTTDLVKDADALLFASRPGLRIWKASIVGSVQSTFIFKDLFNHDYPAISLLEDAFPTHENQDLSHRQFGPLHVYNGSQLLTWTEHGLYVLDPVASIIAGGQENMGTLIDVATYEDEIFILRQGPGRKILRVAQTPGRYQEPPSDGLSLTPPASPVDRLIASTSSSPLTVSPQSNSPLVFFPTSLFGKIRNKDPKKAEDQRARSSSEPKPQLDSPRKITSEPPENVKVVFENAYDGGPKVDSMDIERDSEPQGQVDKEAATSTNLPPVVSLSSDDIASIDIYPFKPLATVKDPSAESNVDTVAEDSTEPELPLNSTESSSEQEASKKSPQEQIPSEDDKPKAVIDSGTMGNSQDVCSESVKLGEVAASPPVALVKSGEFSISSSVDSLLPSSTPNTSPLDETNSVPPSGENDNHLPETSLPGKAITGVENNNLDSSNCSCDDSELPPGGEDDGQKPPGGEDDSQRPPGGEDENRMVSSITSSEYEAMGVEKAQEAMKSSYTEKLEKLKAISEQEFSSDIVFKQKPKKKKKKKHKDKDTDSICSTDSLPTNKSGESSSGPSSQGVSSQPSPDTETNIPTSSTEHNHSSQNGMKESGVESISNENNTEKASESHELQSPMTADKFMLAAEQVIESTDDFVSQSSTPGGETVKQHETPGGKSAQHQQSDISGGESAQLTDSSGGESAQQQSETPGGESVILSEKLGGESAVHTKPSGEVTEQTAETQLTVDSHPDMTLLSDNLENVNKENTKDSEEQPTAQAKESEIAASSLVEEGEGDDSPTSDGRLSIDLSVGGADAKVDWQPSSSISGPVSPDPHDDFYGRYRSQSTQSLASTIDDIFNESYRQRSISQEGSTASSGAEAWDLSQKLADSWTEFFTPGNLQSLCLTDKRIWCVDRSERLYFSHLGGPAVTWRKVNEPAKQIAVSPNSFIVWRLHRGTVYTGTKITVRSPAGLKWVEAARDVQYIAVDNTTAWLIKNSGDMLMQKGLSKERPCYRSLKIPTPQKLLQVACYRGVVWALTEERSVLVRTGTNQKDQGLDWKELDSFGDDDLIVSNITIGDKNTAWVIDILGRVWFCDGVTPEKPEGDQLWWEVSISEYLMQDVTTLDSLKNLASSLDPQNLAKVLQSQQGGLLAAGVNGVWVCPGFKHVLHVCRGSLMGHRWELATPVGLATSSRWSHIAAGGCNGDQGLIWAQQPNGEIFCFPPVSRNFTTLNIPTVSGPFRCFKATQDVVWCLTVNGRVFIRNGIGPHLLQGRGWVELDLTQLGSSKLVSVSVGSQNVWAVDDEGVVYLRIGIKAPTSQFLPPAWVPIMDSKPASSTAGGFFTQVFTGPQDWMVWALDNRRMVYVRRGVTEQMPIGTEWAHVAGTPAIQLTMSSTLVWALNSDGEILCRFGISQSNPLGDYWKKIPGRFWSVSASPNDDLWAINGGGQIHQRYIKHFTRQEDVEDPILKRGRSESNNSETDWELI